MLRFAPTWIVPAAVAVLLAWAPPTGWAEEGAGEELRTSASQGGEVQAAIDTLVGSEIIPPLPPRLSKRPFGVGERFVFSLQYGPIKAGTATLSVEAVDRLGDRSVYRLSSVTRSNRFFSTIYKVRDRVESLLDVGELLTRQSSKQLRQGDFKREEVLEWDQDNDVVRYQDGTEVEVPVGARDVLGAFYFVRTLQLRVGDRVPLQTHDGRKTYPLWIEVLDEERIDTPVGSFDCLVVEPKLQSDGLFRRSGSLKVWLTDDERHMPVMMQSKIKVGAVSAILTDFERGAAAVEIEPAVNAN